MLLVPNRAQPLLLSNYRPEREFGQPERLIATLARGRQDLVLASQCRRDIPPAATILATAASPPPRSHRSPARPTSSAGRWASETCASSPAGRLIPMISIRLMGVRMRASEIEVLREAKPSRCTSCFSRWRRHPHAPPERAALSRCSSTTCRGTRPTARTRAPPSTRRQPSCPRPRSLHPRRPPRAAQAALAATGPVSPAQHIQPRAQCGVSCRLVCGPARLLRVERVGCSLRVLQGFPATRRSGLSSLGGDSGEEDDLAADLEGEEI